MVTRIIFILFSSAFLFGSMVSMVDAEYDKSAQTIKITQDMKDWIGTHFDRKVKGEHLSVSEIEFQEGRFYLKVLSGNRKVLRRMVKSAAEAKEMLKEINNGDPLINYIDKIIKKQRGADTGKGEKEATGQDVSKKDKIQTKESKKADAKPKQETRVTECDTLAAEPFDPGRITAGVSWGELDADSAIKACSQAIEAEPDSARLQYQYGRSLHKKDQYADAIKWYRKAVEQGYAAAQSNLGFLYANGNGVPRDYGEAEKWWRKAAEQGDVKAKKAACFARGKRSDSTSGAASGVPLHSEKRVKS